MKTFSKIFDPKNKKHLEVYNKVKKQHDYNLQVIKNELPEINIEDEDVYWALICEEKMANAWLSEKLSD